MLLFPELLNIKEVTKMPRILEYTDSQWKAMERVGSELGEGARVSLANVFDGIADYFAGVDPATAGKMIQIVEECGIAVSANPDDKGLSKGLVSELKQEIVFPDLLEFTLDHLRKFSNGAQVTEALQNVLGDNYPMVKRICMPYGILLPPRR